MAALLVFMPLALGTVQAWSEQIVIAVAGLIGLLFLLKLVVVPSASFVWSWAYIPIAVFVAVIVLQLLPLPNSLVSLISPHTVALKTETMGDLPDADEKLSSMALTFYPQATKHGLRLFLAASAVFVVVVNVYRRPDRMKRLLAVVAATGGAVALLALAQDLAGNGKIYWVIPAYDNARSGTFINHSHYAQFMNLSIGAALGLLLVRCHEAFRGRKVTPAGVAEYMSSPTGKIGEILLAMMILGAATVFVSLSRGGMVSMLIAAAFTTLVLSWRQSLPGRAWIILLIALGAFVCVLWVGFEEVYDRLGSLQELSAVEGGRWQIVKNTIAAWTRFPLFGTGLGTYEVVYPMFDSSYIRSLATHAENEYVQTLAETGFVGFLALAVFGAGVWASFARSINARSCSISSAAYGLGFGLLAVLIHSLSDFGQHLPANAMLTSVSCGLLITVCQNGAGRGEDALPSRPKGRSVVAGRLVLLLLAASVWVWAMLAADRARVAEAHWSKVLLAEACLGRDDWIAPQEAYEYLFTHATAATEAEPGNIQYGYWLGAYKWLSLTPYIDPNTGRLPPEALPWAQQIVQDLNEVRPLCLTFGPLHCLAGEIERFVLGDPSGAERIRLGYRLAPCDAAACFAAARIDAEDGKADQMLEKLKRAVRLDGSCFPKAVRLCVQDMARADLGLELAGDDPARLAYVGNFLASVSDTPGPPEGLQAGSTDPRSLAQQAEARAFEQLKIRCEQPDASASAHASLANLYCRRDAVLEAIDHYERAVRLDYDQVGWHYALAQLFVQAHNNDEAIRQAQICLQLRPDYGSAKRLIQELSAPSMPPKDVSAAGHM